MGLLIVRSVASSPSILRLHPARGQIWHAPRGDDQRRGQRQGLVLVGTAGAGRAPAAAARTDLRGCLHRRCGVHRPLDRLLPQAHSAGAARRGARAAVRGVRGVGPQRRVADQLDHRRSGAVRAVARRRRRAPAAGGAERHRGRGRTGGGGRGNRRRRRPRRRAHGGHQRRAAAPASGGGRGGAALGRHGPADPRRGASAGAGRRRGHAGRCVAPARRADPPGKARRRARARRLRARGGDLRGHACDGDRAGPCDDPARRRRGSVRRAGDRGVHCPARRRTAHLATDELVVDGDGAAARSCVAGDRLGRV